LTIVLNTSYTIGVSIEFREKKINFAKLEKGRLEFESDNFKVSEEHAQKGRNSVGLHPRSRVFVPMDERKFLRQAARYGQPVSVNDFTYWSLHLFMRSINKISRRRQSISSLIDALIKNAVINPDNLETISDNQHKFSERLRMSPSLREASVGLRKFISIEGHDDKVEEYFVPEITYHDVKCIRILLLSLVSPELLDEDERRQTANFLSSGFLLLQKVTEPQFISQIAKPVSLEMLEKVVGDESIDLIILRDKAKTIRKEVKDVIPARAWRDPKLGIDSYLQSVLHFSFMQDKQVMMLDEHFKNLRYLSKKFGTINYD